MTAATPGQIRLIHKLLRDSKMDEHKIEIVRHHSRGRTSSMKEISLDEAKSIIISLKSTHKAPVDPDKKMKNSILSMAHQLGWQNNGKVDMRSVNGWCVDKSYLKKPLDAYTHEELPRLVNQFKQVFINYLKK